MLTMYSIQYRQYQQECLCMDGYLYLYPPECSCIGIISSFYVGGLCYTTMVHKQLQRSKIHRLRINFFPFQGEKQKSLPLTGGPFLIQTAPVAYGYLLAGHVIWHGHFFSFCGLPAKSPLIFLPIFYQHISTCMCLQGQSSLQLDSWNYA